MMTKSEHTNWADFDAFFNNLQMNDSSRFSALDVNFDRTSDLVSIQPTMNSLHAFDWDDFDANNAAYPSTNST